MTMRRALALVACLLAPTVAAAHEYRAGDLHIVHPWTRATPPGARVAGGYMTIHNTGTVADRLIGGSFVESRAFEVHEMTHEYGVMRMRELEKGLEIAPGQKVELKPGGFHVMMIDLRSPMKEGQSVAGTLVFERAGTISVSFKVEGMAGRGDHDHHQGHGAGHGTHSTRPAKTK
jgi:periplasmic copper chaperone A